MLECGIQLWCDAIKNCFCRKDAYDEDLRRTMARYFGAEGRIALGERFNVLAKRVVPQNGPGGSDGTRVEYLIEWEGCTAKELQESVQKR